LHDCLLGGQRKEPKGRKLPCLKIIAYSRFPTIDPDGFCAGMGWRFAH
jgi:hypothetical protein